MKEEIELAKRLLDEMEKAHEARDIDIVGVKANIIKTIMKSIELSCTASELVNDDGIEPWDPEESFEEEYEDDDTPEEGE